MGDQVTVQRLQSTVSELTRKLRRIEYILTTQPFHTGFQKATERQRNVCARIIKRLDEQSLKTWVDELTSNVLGEMSLNSLKRIGKGLGVHNYSRLNRVALIYAIEQERAKHGKK